ncbi:MAG: TolC family protein [Polyangiales bacterium]
MHFVDPSQRVAHACLTLVLLCALGPLSRAHAEEARPGAAPDRVNLSQAIERALTREPRAEVARQEIARAEALVTQARASVLPVVTGNVTYTRLDAERAAANGARLSAEQQVNANVQVAAPLIAPSRWVGLGQAKDDVDVARRAAEEVRRQLALATARAYLTVVAQQRVIDVNERARANAEAHYQHAHARFEGGIGNELDDVRAGQELADSEAKLEQAHASLISAREALGVLLGADGPVDAVDPEALPTGVEGSATELVANRADVRAERARVRVAERRVRERWADYLPLVTGTFQPFYQNPPTLQFPRTGWQAQLILTVPLFDGLLRKGQADERRAQAAQRRATLEGVLRTARSEVRVAFNTLERADKSLVAAARGADLARRALTMASMAYAAGATTDIEVVDAERRARDAETSAVVAEDAARRARLDLLIATGQLP